jgi:hypothetical protein
MGVSSKVHEGVPTATARLCPVCEALLAGHRAMRCSARLRVGVRLLDSGVFWLVRLTALTGPFASS